MNPDNTTRSEKSHGITRRTSPLMRRVQNRHMVETGSRQAAARGQGRRDGRVTVNGSRVFGGVG